MPSLLLIACGFVATGFGAGGAYAATCREAISAAEAAQSIPRELLSAIGHVESGRADPVTGEVSPWPWTADINGEGHFYPSKQQAITAVIAARAQGIQSIDVGCLQINLLHHPDAFVSLAQAFDPTANANYGALFLRQLHDQLGSWPQAAAAYHSQTPSLGMAYERLVMRAWPEEQQLANAEPEDGDDWPGSAPSYSPMPAALMLPFRNAPGLIRMGAALPPIGGGMARLVAANISASGNNGAVLPPAGRNLAEYRRVPIRRAVPRGALAKLG